MFLRIIVAILFSINIGCLVKADDEQNYKNLFNQLKLLTEKGNAEAAYHLGMLYNNGIGTEQSYKLAYQYFKQAEQGGDPLASYKIGCYYAGQAGNVVPFNKNKAFEYKLRAANAGYSFAQSDIANYYAEKGNWKEAEKWWIASAKQGFTQALFNLASYYNSETSDFSKAYSFTILAARAAFGRLTPEVTSYLENLARYLSTEEVAAAHNFANSWKFEKTPLTSKATNGIDESFKLVENASSVTD